MERLVGRIYIITLFLVFCLTGIESFDTPQEICNAYAQLIENVELHNYTELEVFFDPKVVYSKEYRDQVFNDLKLTNIYWLNYAQKLIVAALQFSETHHIIKGVDSSLNTLQSNITKLFLAQGSLDLADKLEKIAKERNCLVIRPTEEGRYLDVEISGAMMLGDSLHALSLRDALASGYSIEQALSLAIKGYKIHLMPRDEDLVKVTTNLMNIIEANQDLQENISLFKIKAFTEELIKEDKDPVLMEIPKIVIYATNGSEGAQKVLNVIYRHFKNWPGLGRRPLFNEKVTDLIYFAQGSRDDKKVPEYAKYFEKGKVYFKPDIVERFGPEFKNEVWPDLKEGERPNFHLHNPGR